MNNIKNLGRIKEGRKVTQDFELSFTQDKVKDIRLSCPLCLSFKMKDKTLTLVYKPGKVEKVIRLYPGYYTFNKSATVTYTDGVTETFTILGKVTVK